MTKSLLPLLELRGICKVFGGVRAVWNVDFKLFPGECVGLVGDNGAGKSTLVKLISGVYQPDAGEIWIKGQKVVFGNPRDAVSKGIEVVYQDLALCNNLDVTSNFFLGRELVWHLGVFPLSVMRSRLMWQRTEQSLKELGINLGSVKQRVESLSGGQRQAIALARAIAWGSDIVLFDEPTAALGVRESSMALDLISHLREQGASIIIISHNIQHILSVAERLLVMRQGQYGGEYLVKDVSADYISKKMMGE